jgi:hypothetical protein
MARAVGRAEVGFRLDQAEHQPFAVDLVHQVTAQKIPGDGLGGTAVEGKRERAKTAHAIRTISSVSVAHALLPGDTTLFPYFGDRP